jgi:hypothetical protein
MHHKTQYAMSHGKKKHLLVSFGIFFVITVMRLAGVWGSAGPLKKLKDIFTHLGFVIGFIIAIAWTIFILVFGGANYFTDDDEIYNSYIEATKHGVLAIIIALFAKIELIIPVFWLVWLVAFYLDGWA